MTSVKVSNACNLFARYRIEESDSRGLTRSSIFMLEFGLIFSVFSILEILQFFSSKECVV
ncbi:hypothetical protein BD408DRAFT_410315 [Parasitella parasitica]|nr:hypothetical protein BD408DRAFT_410315 [Parasitella parasitica]